MDRIVFRHVSGRRTSEVDAFPAAEFSSIVIGRDPAADVRFDLADDTVVGRRHGSVRRHPEEPDRFLLVDLGSRNGTYLNGRRVRGSIDLAPGDLLQFGVGGPACEFDLEPRPLPGVDETAIPGNGTKQLLAPARRREQALPVVDGVLVGGSRRSPLALAALGLVLLAAVGAGLSGLLRPGRSFAPADSVARSASAAGAPTRTTTAYRADIVLPSPAAPAPATPQADVDSNAGKTTRAGSPSHEPRERSATPAPTGVETPRTASARGPRPASRGGADAAGRREVTPPPAATAPTEAAGPAASGHVSGGVLPGGPATGESAVATTSTSGVSGTTFDKVKLVRMLHDRITETNVRLRLEDDQLVLADARHGGVLKALPYSSLQQVAYAASKHPRWNGTATSPGEAVVGLFGRVFKSTRHWLNLRTADGETILRLDKRNVAAVCDSIARHTNMPVESLVNDEQ